MRLLWGIPPDIPTPTYTIPPLFTVQVTPTMDIAAIIAIPAIQPGDFMSGITPGQAGDSDFLIPAVPLDSPLDLADGIGGDGGVLAGIAAIEGGIAMVTGGELLQVTEQATGKANVTPHEETCINPREIRQG